MNRIPTIRTHRGTTPRGIHVTLGAAWALVTLLLVAPHASAQQFAVDDAAVTEQGACQAEAWWGESERWILPACTLLPATELTLGVAWLDAGFGSRDAHGVIEAKSLFRDADAGPWGWGIAVGAALPLGNAGSPTSAWAHVPITLHADRVPAAVHLNAGWGFEREDHGDHAHDHHGLAWGARTDLELHPRAWLIGEVYGLTGDGAEMQAGLRSVLVPDRLMLDLSRSTALSSGEEGPGFRVGLAWTPAPLGGATSAAGEMR